MKFSPQLCFAVLTSLASADAHRCKHEYMLGLSGHLIRCRICHPGTFLALPCTQEWSDSECRPCPKGTFSSECNVASACTPCKMYCPKNGAEQREEVKTACTPTSDLQCGCKQGFYESHIKSSICKAWMTCPPGSGVTSRGMKFSTRIKFKNTTFSYLPSPETFRKKQLIFKLRNMKATLIFLNN